jgi:hypothetical protein
VTLSPDDIREASMVIYHRWRAFLPHAAARSKALQFAVRCRRLIYVPPCLPEVTAVLAPDAGATPREINARMPEATRSSVNEALLILVRSGRASFEGEMGRRRYRLTEGHQ